MARDELGAMEYAAAFEMIRHHGRRELQRGVGVRELAEELRLSESTLRRFLDGGGPALHSWHALTDFTQNRPPVMPHAATMALAALVAALPMPLRREARERVASGLAAFLSERGRRAPDWLDEELRGWSGEDSATGQ